MSTNKRNTVQKSWLGSENDTIAWELANCQLMATETHVVSFFGGGGYNFFFF